MKFHEESDSEIKTYKFQVFRISNPPRPLASGRVDPRFQTTYPQSLGRGLPLPIGSARNAVRSARSLFWLPWSLFGRFQGLFKLQLGVLSSPSSVNLPFLAPTCSPTSQLSLKIGPNLASKLISHRFCDPPNLDFCNTLQCF